jgi:predicted MFS family arabinose efflux permease
MVPVGAGMGTAIPPLINLVLRAVPPADAGAASGMLVTSQQIGNALGVALVGTVFFGELGTATSTAAFGDAFSVAMAVQAAFALTAAALVSRARQTTEERMRGGVPAGEGV